MRGWLGEAGQGDKPKGPEWGPAIKPPLVPELGGEMRKAELWTHVLVYSIVWQAWEGLGRRQGRPGLGVTRRAEDLAGERQLGGGADFTTFQRRTSRDSTVAQP